MSRALFEWRLRHAAAKPPGSGATWQPVPAPPSHRHSIGRAAEDPSVTHRPHAELTSVQKVTAVLQPTSAPGALAPHASCPRCSTCILHTHSTCTHMFDQTGKQILPNMHQSKGDTPPLRTYNTPYIHIRHACICSDVGCIYVSINVTDMNDACAASPFNWTLNF